MTPSDALVRAAPALTLTVLVGPVAAGVLAAAAPAFGWDPAVGRMAPGLEAWRALAAQPGLARSVAVGLTTGLAAAAVSLTLALAAVAAWRGTPAFAWLERALAPLLSLPHAAAAFGLAFLIAPSGWAVRAVSPWATGWATPPDALIVGDPLGLALTLGLIVKETPFLLLMTLAALSRVDADRAVLAARSLGAGRVWAFLVAVLPQIWPQLRLPVYAVAVYGVSTVDMAVVLGPSAPPTLAVRALRWSADPDLGLRGLAAAGALLQLAMALTAVAALWAAERALAPTGRRAAQAGLRLAGDGPARAAAVVGAGGAAALAGAGIAAMAVWSVAGLWTFPDAWPDALTGRSWSRAAPALADAAAATAWIGAAATAAAMALTVGCLEAEHRFGLRLAARALPLLYLPLLVPQLSVVFGLQTLAAAAGLDGGLAVVAAVHVVFVAPYVFLSFGPPFRAWDARAGLAARTLGAGPDRVLLAVRLPMLLRPALTAAAVGFAVSAGQYLPTLMIGGGRVETLTTEAVALASGGDRRAIGVWAAAQAAAPAAGFALALGLAALAHRERRGLRP